MAKGAISPGGGMAGRPFDVCGEPLPSWGITKPGVPAITFIPADNFDADGGTSDWLCNAIKKWEIVQSGDLIKKITESYNVSSQLTDVSIVTSIAVILAVTAAAATAAAVGIELGHVGAWAASGGVTAFPTRKYCPPRSNKFIDAIASCAACGPSNSIKPNPLKENF